MCVSIHFKTFNADIIRIWYNKVLSWYHTFFTIISYCVYAWMNAGGWVNMTNSPKKSHHILTWICKRMWHSVGSCCNWKHMRYRRHYTVGTSQAVNAGGEWTNYNIIAFYEPETKFDSFFHKTNHKICTVFIRVLFKCLKLNFILIWACSCNMAFILSSLIVSTNV
jgi:hypothetical protein